MIKPWENHKKLKDLMAQFITVVVIAALALLLLNVLSEDKDGRRQVVDNDGGEEYTAAAQSSAEEEKLAEILSQIKGVGAVEVMITYKDTDSASSVFSSDVKQEKKVVKGVIIAAEGAADAVTKNGILKAVASVFDIPQDNVMVFEKEAETRGY